VTATGREVASALEEHRLDRLAGRVRRSAKGCRHAVHLEIHTPSGAGDL